MCYIVYIIKLKIILIFGVGVVGGAFTMNLQAQRGEEVPEGRGIARISTSIKKSEKNRGGIK
jgi:hypothetical protein